MNVQAEKAIIIEQFKQVNDINLILAIKSMLDYAFKKEADIYDIPEEHQRIVMQRFEQGLSQTELAQKIEISYPQMSRYEVKDVQPPSDVLKRLADTLNTSVDYLVNGDVDEKAKASLNDARLLGLFKSVERMNDDDKTVIKRLISTFIFEREMQSRLVQNA